MQGLEASNAPSVVRRRRSIVWNVNRVAISLVVTMEGKAAHVGWRLEGVNAP
jgi:hypothetical protein